MKDKKTDKILTIQVHHENLNPRTFKVPIRWIHQFSILAWVLVAITLTSVFYAVKTPRMNFVETPVVIQEKIKPALIKKEDPNATDSKPAPETGLTMEPVEGVWTGLAPQITLPSSSEVASIELSEIKLRWEGKFAVISGMVAYREPGKGSQQGHLVVLARGTDRIFSHPENVFNVPSNTHLFDPDHGEYFSVSRFRILKTRLGPFENPLQLNQIQIFLFDLNRKLLVLRSFKNGKK